MRLRPKKMEQKRPEMNVLVQSHEKHTRVLRHLDEFCIKTVRIVTKTKKLTDNNRVQAKFAEHDEYPLSKKLDMNMSMMLSIVSMFDEFEMVSVITVDEECCTNDEIVTNDLSDFEVQFDRSEDVNIPHRIRTLF